MILQPEDFWSFYEWLMRPESFLESALLQGIVLFVLAIVIGLMVGYIISANRYGPGEGFYAVARAIRDLVRFDLPGTSAHRVFALARLAFKEAIRRKVLFVVGLFVALLLLAGWYLNPESSDPARLYISFVLTATNYLILALALFISAFSLPNDIKSKTIYTIVTKPVRATEIVLGRMLGFMAVGTVMLVPMGLASYLFVSRGLSHRHAEVVDVVKEADGSLVGETDYVQDHKHSFTIYPNESDPDGVAQGLTDLDRGHRHIVTRDANGNFEIGPPEPLRARIPSYGEIQFFDRGGNLKDAGVEDAAGNVVHIVARVVRGRVLLSPADPGLQILDRVDDAPADLRVAWPRAIGPVFFERPPRKAEKMGRFRRSQIAWGKSGIGIGHGSRLRLGHPASGSAGLSETRKA